MYRSLFIVFLCFIISLGVVSCYDKNNTFGNKWVNSEFRNISMDTSTITLTAVLIDSLETSGKQVALAGTFTHPVWGSISAISYIPYRRPSYPTEADATVRFDSLMLVLAPDKEYVGDTTLQQQYSIHLLTDKVVLKENGYLYNNSSFAYNPHPLAVYSFRPRPNTPEKIEIRLPDELGRDLLTRLHKQDESVSENRFEDYFKGIAIVPDKEQCHSLLNFQVADSITALILHYHIEGGYENHQKLVISPNTETQFNQLLHDRRNTPMEPYPWEKAEIPWPADKGSPG